MPAGAGHGDSGVEADHLRANHGHGLTLGWVHLARHDRAARLIGWQFQLIQASPGPAGEQTDVVGDFEQADRQLPQLTHGIHKAVMAGHDRELVGGCAEWQARELS